MTLTNESSGRSDSTEGKASSRSDMSTHEKHSKVVSISPSERPVALKGSTYKMQTGCGPLYVTINEDEEDLFELFTTMGKGGGCAASQCEAIGRMVSLAWRSGVQPETVIRQLIDVACHSPFGFGEKKIFSCADAVAKAIQQHISSNDHVAEKIKRKPMIRGACPDCGGRIMHQEGCAHCPVATVSADDSI